MSSYYHDYLVNCRGSIYIYINTNTKIAAIALPPSNMHPQLWAECLHIGGGSGAAGTARAVPTLY